MTMLLSVGTKMSLERIPSCPRTDGILWVSVLTSQQSRMARDATGVVAVPLFSPVLRLGGNGSTRREADGRPRSSLFPCRGGPQESSDILGCSGQLTYCWWGNFIPDHSLLRRSWFSRGQVGKRRSSAAPRFVWRWQGHLSGASGWVEVQAEVILTWDSSTCLLIVSTDLP